MRLIEFIVKPTIIDGLGNYQTRCGEQITITKIVKYHAYGHYADDVEELWDVSGRVLPWTPTNNDIIKKLT